MSRTFSGLPQPTGLIQEGSLYSATITSSRYDVRWASAELRTAELLSRIQPNELSEKRRKAVAEYVKRLVDGCFECQVFTFGSVPLKTYLPDGDIDLTAFSRHRSLKDTWAIHVQSILEHEEQRKNTEFCVKEVQCIQAEVKIVKCLVENIVVDISFNQLGGLCTLCFLEEVDRLIERDHLFKRSIILVKAWCYYESRLLGAPHGLLSTYALETLVLYIFNVFHTFLRGPLEVLFKFLDYFSNFDWDKYCVSLWGPIPLESIPDLTAEPPRRDGGKLLLSKDFLEACSDAYSVFPKGQDTQSRTFVGKYLNIVDPLRTNNNLGRSVSKASFFRIRSAFSLGARKMAKLFESSDQDFARNLDNFFSSTWKSNQTHVRRDAPDSIFPPFQPSDHNTFDVLHIIHRNTPDVMARPENKEKIDESHSASKSDLHHGNFRESLEVSTSRSTANTAIHVIDGDVEIRESGQDVHSPDSISYREEVQCFSQSLSSHESNKHDNKQDNPSGAVISTNVVDCQNRSLLLRTKSLGDSLSITGEVGEGLEFHMRRSTSDGRLDNLADTQVVKTSRLQGDAQDLALEQMHSVSMKEAIKNRGPISGVAEDQKIFSKTYTTRLGGSSSTALPMDSNISEKGINISSTCHQTFTRSMTEKDMLVSELTAASSSRNGNLNGNRVEGRASLGSQITQDDSRSSTPSRSQFLTTSKHDAQRLPDLALSEPHDQFAASDSHPLSLHPYMPLSGHSTFTPSPGFVGPFSPLEMSLGNPSSTNSQQKVVPLTPTVVAVQVPQVPVSPPVQFYLELPSVAIPPPVLQSFEDIGGHTQVWPQEQEVEQEHQQQFRLVQPWSYLNTSAIYSAPLEDAELNQYKMEMPSTTGAPQGSNALAKGRNSLKESKLIRGKGAIKEINAAESSSSSINVNTSAYEGLLESSRDAPQVSVNRCSVSIVQNLQSYATVTVNRSTVVSPVVPSVSSNELTVPLIGGQLSVGHYSTFPSTAIENSSKTENLAQGPTVGSILAPGASARYVAAGFPFPTLSYYNPFYVATQVSDHGFGSEVSNEFGSHISHDDDSRTVPDGDHESKSASRVDYGAGERLKAAGAAGSTGLLHAKASAGETIVEPSMDLLSSDFLNHRRNLEFGRWCQDPGMCSFIYPPSILQPPKYIQGPFYSEGLHRPIHADMFAFSQVPGSVQGSIPGALLMQGYGHMPGTFSGPGPGALSIGGDSRKPRTGTGTYLPLRHGSYKDAQMRGVRYQQATYNPDQGRSGNMGSASRRRGIGHRQYNTDGYSQAQIDGAVGIDRHTAEGKLGDRNTWQKDHHLISAYPPVSSSFVLPASLHGPSNGFPGMNVYSNPPHDPGGNSAGNALPLGSGQLEFGSFGPVQIGSVPGELNPGQEVGIIQHGVSTADGARVDAYPLFANRDTKQTLPTGPQRTVHTYQLREDDFPPLPLHGQHGGSSIKSNVDN